MRVKLIVLTLLFISACGRNKKEGLEIFNGLKFKLYENENTGPRLSGDIELYESILKEDPLHIPLYKYVKSKDYILYLGIPFNASIRELIDSNEMRKPHDALTSDSSTYFFNSYHKEKNQVVEYCRVFDKNMVYVLAVSNAEMTSDSTFTEERLSRRFIQE
ncbi:MAG: hypothetical protein GC180_00720 [Bacteroidetes bacterium]|nr:hypothetical protein [Bacteroidota bacterium]